LEGQDPRGGVSMAIGRISGPLLKANLLRDGVDLAFETDLLYLDVNGGQIGIKNSSPSYTLDVTGTINSTNLRGGSLTVDNVSVNNNTITALSGDINLSPATGFDFINLNGNVEVTGNIHATGSITADGDLQLGDDSTDSIVFNADIDSNIIPNIDNTYDIGSDAKKWRHGYFYDLTIENLDVGNFEGILGQDIPLGTNTIGSLVSNAGNFTTQTAVTDGIAQLNFVLGKLVPDQPPTFNEAATLAIQSTNTYRMADFVQTDNTTSNRNVAGGTTVTNVRRASSYLTNILVGVGPGSDGVVTVFKNGVAAGSRTMTDTQDPNTLLGDDNGLYGDLTISNDRDDSLVTGIAATFWQSFDVRAAGNVNEGWNEVFIEHTLGSDTNVAAWYYDASTPGTPQLTNTSITPPIAPSLSYSSTVPHYTNSNVFNIEFDTNRLSGDMYPTSDTFVTGVSAGAFLTPASRTYSQVGVTTPLARNLYVSGGTVNVTTTSQIRTGFGQSSAGPTVRVANSYATGSSVLSPGATVLYKTGTNTQIEETSIPVNSVGVGVGNAVRILNPGSDNNPVISSTSIFNSQNSTLETYDAAVVGAVLRHDQTNYSTGYLPAGPDLSTGRSGTQYFTFKFTRSVVSKFDIRYSGQIAGLWIALPGSQIDTTSTLNGWLNCNQAYSGSGVPGAGAGGNGSNGCAVGGVASLNTTVSNFRVTATFGTESSSNTLTNEIIVRVALTTGDAVTLLTIEEATN
jgi:hypothetical protein